MSILACEDAQLSDEDSDWWNNSHVELLLQGCSVEDPYESSSGGALLDDGALPDWLIMEADFATVEE